MKKNQQEDFILNEDLSTAQEKPKGKDADYYTRILVGFTFGASALLILFNVITGFFPVKSSVFVQSSASFSSISSRQPFSSSVSSTRQTDVVYWTSGGSVYHLKSDCSALSRSANVLSGSVENAHKAGKANACKICGGS